MRLSRHVLLLALGLLVATVWPSSVAPRALAHPLDEYLQALYVTLGGDGVGVELDLTPGVLVAPQVIALIDADGDGQITEAEAQDYARHVLDELTVDIDQQSYAAVPTKALFPPMLNLTAGVGVIHLEATLVPNGTAVLLEAGSHAVTVRNGHAPATSAYQSAVVLQPGGQVTVSRQTRDESQQTLRVDYSIRSPYGRDIRCRGIERDIVPPERIVRTDYFSDE